MKLPASYIAIDLETTGVNPNTCRIIQIACITVIDGAITKKSNQLIDCGSQAIDEHAFEKHGITKADLTDQPHWSNVAWDYFSLFDNSLPIVTYNGTRFDIPVLEREFDRAEVPIPGVIDHHDAYIMAKERIAIGSYTQSAVAEALNLPQWKAHDAFEDAMTLVKIFEQLKLKPLLSQAQEPVDPAKYALAIRQHADTLANARPSAQAALQMLSPHIAKIAATVDRANMLDCENEEDYRKTVQAEIFIKKLERSLTKMRTDAVRDIKATVKEIETAWRQLILNPLAGAKKHIELVREPYLLLQHQQKMEAHRKLQEEARAIAAQAANTQMQAGQSQSEANAYAESVEFELRDRGKAAIDAINRTQTKMGSANSVVQYRCNIIDTSSVPKHLWSPDLKLIEAEAHKYDGRNIPGVEIIPTFTHTTRAKRK